MLPSGELNLEGRGFVNWAGPPRGGRWGHRPRRRPATAPLAAALVLTLVTGGCGRPDPSDRLRRLSGITDFATLFGTHCSGCHGAEGKLGPGAPLNDPLFLAILPEDVFENVVTSGRAGTLMPAMGGKHWDSLTAEQVKIVISGIRRRWASGATRPAENAPPYLTPPTTDGSLPGDPRAGAKLFANICAKCHGPEGGGGKDAGPLHRPAFLALVSNQLLRRIVITGRPDLGMPDYRGLGANRPSGRPLNSPEVSDIVAYVAGWREPSLSLANED
jgi:cytochrome c oxidase cbb3-type subunit 3